MCVGAVLVSAQCKHDILPPVGHKVRPYAKDFSRIFFGYNKDRLFPQREGGLFLPDNLINHQNKACKRQMFW